jgi:hypothetical protein
MLPASLKYFGQKTSKKEIDWETYDNIKIGHTDTESALDKYDSG